MSEPTNERGHEDTASQDETVSQTDDTSRQNDLSSLPEWAQADITKTRREAANYRTKLRQAQDDLGRIDEARAALRAGVARLYGLSPETAELLTGDDLEDLEDLEAQAAKLAAAIRSRRVVGSSTSVLGGAPEPRGGLDPQGSADGEMNPRKLAQLHKRVQW